MYTLSLSLSLTITVVTGGLKGRAVISSKSIPPFLSTSHSFSALALTTFHVNANEVTIHQPHDKHHSVVRFSRNKKVKADISILYPLTLIPISKHMSSTVSESRQLKQFLGHQFKLLEFSTKTIARPYYIHHHRTQ